MSPFFSAPIGCIYASNQPEATSVSLLHSFGNTTPDQKIAGQCMMKFQVMALAKKITRTTYTVLCYRSE